MNITNINIELKILNSNHAKNLKPEYSTNGAAGIDLKVAIEKNIIILPKMVKLIPTGIAIHIKDKNIAGIILPRSGLGHNKGLILGNTIGLIDSDYQGEIMLSCFNRSNKSITITPLMRVAQLIFIPIIHANFMIVNEFCNKTKRNDQGFGHTGKI